MTAIKLPIVATISAIVAATCAWLIWRARRQDPRQQAVKRLLDAADALEARLRTAREEIERSTGAEDASIRSVLQEMLRQRLWLQQHGADASIAQLDEIRQSFEQAQFRIDQQLALVQHAKL